MLRQKSLVYLGATASSVILAISIILLAHSETDQSFIIPCTITTYGKAWNGELAYGLFQFNPVNTTQEIASYLVVWDPTNWNLVNIRESNGSSYFGSVDLVAPDTLIFQGEPDSTTHFWNFTSNSTENFPDVSGHHDVEYNPVNNTFLTLRNYVREVNGTNIIFDKIVEFSANGTVLWTWDTYDHIPLSEQSIFNITGVFNGEPAVDFTHANSLEWDYNQSVIYLNCRHTNTFYKIDQETGNIIWACGEFGNFTLLDAQGKPVRSLWYGCHDVRQVEPDVFIMFNNDFSNVTNPNDDHSAMQEVTLNEQNMTAWVSWSWTAPVELYSSHWGETARLPNGDRIGVFGAQTHPYAETTPYLVNDTGAVLVEVNPQGQVVRTYAFPKGWGIYRIEIISTPAQSTTPSPSPSPAPTPTPTPTPVVPEFPSWAVLPLFTIAMLILAAIYRRKRVH